jgi:hypothetical protein
MKNVQWTNPKVIRLLQQVAYHRQSPALFCSVKCIETEQRRCMCVQYVTLDTECLLNSNTIIYETVTVTVTVTVTGVTSGKFSSSLSHAATGKAHFERFFLSENLVVLNNS